MVMKTFTPASWEIASIPMILSESCLKLSEMSTRENTPASINWWLKSALKWHNFYKVCNVREDIELQDLCWQDLYSPFRQ